MEPPATDFDGLANAQAAKLIDALRRAVGWRDIVTAPAKTRRFRIGYRYGAGEALAVVRPRSSVAMWRALQACVTAGAAIIVQAANTSLTGGATPHGRYSRPVVVINTSRLRGQQLVQDGAEVICRAGARLHDLERVLGEIGREPHSVIGSSCIGASVVGGVCNNSGGALVQRGPAYTEHALYARVSPDGQLELVNDLGLVIDGSPEDVLARLDRFELPEPAEPARVDDHYLRRIRDIDACSPARFNADPERLHACSGSAGKVAVFAVRVPTFRAPARRAVFYVGTNDAQRLTTLRREILGGFHHLPVSAEYLDRSAFDLAERYGKDTVVLIGWLGTDRIPALFAVKGWVDRQMRAIAGVDAFADRALQGLSALWPRHLPRRLTDFRDRFEHHLILTVADDGIEETRAYLARNFRDNSGDAFECDPKETRAAMLHRFAVAGAAVRYRALNTSAIADVVSLDVALRRNDTDWCEHLPASAAGGVERVMAYGHFLCHVFHRDYIIRKGVDASAVEAGLVAAVEQAGGKCPAEHNVGHKYRAEPQLADFYRQVDPTNSFNPGIGGMSRERAYQGATPR